MQNSIENQGAAIRKIKEDDEVVLRRMDILKTAMQAMEFQVDDITGFGDAAEGNS